MRAGQLDYNERVLKALGESISQKRLNLGLSQQDLASAAGVHRSYMSDVEKGAEKSHTQLVGGYRDSARQ